VVERVCVLAGQLRVCKALSGNLGRGQREAVSIGQLVVFPRTVVVPENLFAEVMVKMKRFHSHIRAAQSPLQEAPEVVESLGVERKIALED
jgi:hypothetical protein